MKITAMDIAQILFVLGLMLLLSAVILVPGPNFMENIVSSALYVLLGVLLVTTGSVWMKYIEAKTDARYNEN